MAERTTGLADGDSRDGANIAAVIAVFALVAGGAWLFNNLSAANDTLNCVASDRTNCHEILPRTRLRIDRAPTADGLGRQPTAQSERSAVRTLAGLLERLSASSIFPQVASRNRKTFESPLNTSSLTKRFRPGRK